MAELVDAQDLKSCDFGHAGSIPALGTNQKIPTSSGFFGLLLIYFCKSYMPLLSVSDYLPDYKTSIYSHL